MRLDYKKQVFYLVAWVPIVILIFKIPVDRSVASLIAGLGFVIWPSIFLFVELKNKKNIIHLSSVIIFLLFSAVPIMLLRLTNWGVNFELIHFYGISAAFLHRLSNILYFLMLLSAFYHWRWKK